MQNAEECVLQQRNSFIALLFGAPHHLVAASRSPHMASETRSMARRVPANSENCSLACRTLSDPKLAKHFLNTPSAFMAQLAKALAWKVFIEKWHIPSAFRAQPANVSTKIFLVIVGWHIPSSTYLVTQVHWRAAHTYWRISKLASIGDQHRPSDA